MADKKGLAAEFRDFIAGGNMIELAVAVILGLAIGKVIDAFTNGVMMQIVAAIFGKPNFDQLTVGLSGTPLYIGKVLTELISLVMTGLVLFAIVKAYNAMKDRTAASEPAPGPNEVDLLTEIRDALKARN